MKKTAATLEGNKVRGHGNTEMQTKASVNNTSITVLHHVKADALHYINTPKHTYLRKQKVKHKENTT